jgi:hypothetical protein
MRRESWLATLRSLALVAMVVQPVAEAENNGFTDHSFRGSYALGIIGTVVSVGPVAGTGLLTSDGRGSLVGTQTISYGVGPCVLTLAGTYTVHADGTGTGTVTVTSAVGGPLCTSGNGSNVDFSFVLSGGPGTADKIKLSETSTGFAILAQGERQ